MDPTSLHPVVENPPFQTILVLQPNGRLSLRAPTQTPDSDPDTPLSSASSTPTRSRLHDIGSPPKTRATLCSIENTPILSGRFTDRSRSPATTGKPRPAELHQDAWFHVMCFLSIDDLCAFHTTSRAVAKAAGLAVRRVERLRMWHQSVRWRTHILEALLRGGCANLKTLDVPGYIEAIGKIVERAWNIEKITALAPNLLSRHLTHPLPALAHLSLWVDEHYTDDLTVIATRCRGLTTLRLTATAGLTVYDQQVIAVFRGCTELQRVHFQGVRITDDIASEIAHLKNVHSLRLEDAGLTDEVCLTLVDSLAATTSLRSLSLKRNNLTPTAIAAIGQSPRLRASLAGLNISGSGDIFAGTFHMVCAGGFLPRLRQLRVAPRLVSVFRKQMGKTRPTIDVCSRGLALPRA